jgi:hypothetical protein
MCFMMLATLKKKGRQHKSMYRSYKKDTILITFLCLSAQNDLTNFRREIDTYIGWIQSLTLVALSPPNSFL